MAKECYVCKKQERLLGGKFVAIRDKTYCPRCGEDFVKNAISGIKMTTTNNIDGFFVKRYISIESVEVVIGTGMFSEIDGEVADFFGQRSTAFEKKLQTAKKIALDKLKYLTFEKGGNSIIGVDLDYTEFSGNRIGLIANGTIVEIEPIK